MVKFDGLVIGILCITVLSNSAYAIIAPFMPLEFKRKDIDQVWIGYILSAYPIAVILFSPRIEGLLQKFGRRKLIFFGVFLMGSSFIVYGFISFL